MASGSVIETGHPSKTAAGDFVLPSAPLWERLRNQNWASVRPRKRLMVGVVPPFVLGPAEGSNWGPPWGSLAGVTEGLDEHGGKFPDPKKGGLGGEGRLHTS